MRYLPDKIKEKINERHQTAYNNAQPKVSIQVSRAKTTVMDSTYWTVETIRDGANLGDIFIAPRRQITFGNPDRLYEIHVEGDFVKTALREYPDNLKQGWQNVDTLGTGSAVAIAFDGHWELFRKKWRLVTAEKPYIFWVDSEGKLWRRLWDEVATKGQLSSDVVKVKAIRAWKNTNFVLQDQGVVVAYIKTDGKIYYRNYCTQVDGNVVWETEKELTMFMGTAVNLNLFIANDYRMGFVIEDSLGKIWWLITPKNWAGMALAHDKFVVRPSINIDFIETNKIKGIHDERFLVDTNMSVNLLYASTFNEFIEMENVNDGSGNFGKLIKFTLRYKARNITTQELVLTGNNEYRYAAVQIQDFNDYYVAEFMDFNNELGNLKLSLVRVTAINEGGYGFRNFEKTFIPTGLVPLIIDPPALEAIWNE